MTLVRGVPEPLSVRRTVVAAMLWIAMLGVISHIAYDAIDPAVQIQQTDLYRQDFFSVPLADGASATQSVAGEGLVRVDVLARSAEGGVLRLRMLDRSGTVLRTDSVDVAADTDPGWVVFTFPMIESDDQVYATLDAPPGTDVHVYGSTCDCMEEGEFTFDPGEGRAEVRLQDLHVGTYTVVTSSHRARLLADRIDAYAPAWLSVPVTMVVAALGMLASAAAAALMLVRATRGTAFGSFLALGTLCMLVPVALVLLLTSGWLA